MGQARLDPGETKSSVGLKEWAAVCAALETGRQAILLRKGGLVEAGGTFRVEHSRFWLYPTFLHQQEQGVTPDGRPFLEAALRHRPQAGTVNLSLIADVVEAVRIGSLPAALALAEFHILTAETIRSRFEYREPGLTLLVLRVSRATPHATAETAEQAGCRSWVPLGEPLDPGIPDPVLDDDAFARVLSLLHERLADPAGGT